MHSKGATWKRPLRPVVISSKCVVSSCLVWMFKSAVIQGFDNYLKPPTSGINKKKLDVTEQDRLFSTSSGTYQQVRRRSKVDA